MALGAAAELDSANILKWTAEHFGPGRPTLIETGLFGPSVKSPMVPTLRGRGPEAPIWEAEAHELYSGTPDRAWKWLPTIDPDW